MLLMADSSQVDHSRAMTGVVPSSAPLVDTVVTFSFTRCSKIGLVHRTMAYPVDQSSKIKSVVQCPKDKLTWKSIK